MPDIGPLLRLAGALVAATAVLGWTNPTQYALAQQPACRGFLEFADDEPIKAQTLPGLSIAVASIPDEKGLADPGTLIDEVTARWSDATTAGVKGQAKCIWVALKVPGDGDFPGFANFILAPSERQFTYLPEGIEGTICFRFVLISEQARGEPADRCVAIKHSRPLLVASDSNPNGSVPPGPRPPGAPATGTGESSVSGAQWWIGAGVLVAAALVLGTAFVRGRGRTRPGE